MDIPNLSYLAQDRLRALLSRKELPQSAAGSVLFADISGFTPLTEQLRVQLGNRRGAEALAALLNRVYDALVAEVDHYGGSIIGFAGDAITCWFGDENSTARAAACGFALLTAMRSVEHISLPESEPMSLGLKVAITTGVTQRFLVGAPEIQRLDALAGAVVARIVIGEELAERGELLVDATTVEQLGNLVEIRSWRQDDQERFAVLERLITPVQPTPQPLENVSLANEALLSEMLPLFARNLSAGVDAFQIELRPVTVLFLRFTGIDYDGDPNARVKLDQLFRLIQQVVADYAGNILQLTIGDKGSYLYAAFGAPYAHEDDSVRAVSAALDIRDQTLLLNFLEPVQIGISQGIMRTGTYGGNSRRTYGVLGDEVNLAARLMQRAEPGTILISESVLGDKLDHFALQSLSPIQFKGKAHPIQVFQVVGPRERSFEARFYTTPLVGRSDMLAQLEEAFKPLLKMQHAGIIYIHGEAGMGKSRLVFEAQQRLQAHMSVTWLIGQADQLNRSPLSAFTYFLRPYFGQQRERDAAANLTAFEQVFADLVANDEVNRAELLIHRSFLAGAIGLVIPGSPYETADEKLRADSGIAAIKTWARAISRRGPLVIQLEDAQWLDVSSISTVQQLTYNMEDVPLVLILTSRYNDDGSPLIIQNIYSVPVHTFDLNRLSDDEVRAVAGAVLHGTISERLAHFISQRAEGNPFFTEQLVLDLQERNVMLETQGAWDIRPDAVADVPTNVNAVLIARLDRLAAQVKAVVQTAAVLGREFEVAVLSRMLRVTDPLIIQEAERQAIWSALDELRYLFRHALLRDAAYNMQAQERLKGLHQLAAETIETLYPNDSSQDDVLLEHWRSAQISHRILHYTVPVCERLIRLTADYPRAEKLLLEALTLDSTPTRIILLRLLGDVAELRSDYATATSYYEACLNMPDGTDTHRIRVLNGLANITKTQGDRSKAANFSQQALELARKYEDQEGIAQSLSSLGAIENLLGNYDVARTHFEESLRLYRSLNMQSGVVASLNSLAGIATKKGNVDEARRYLEACLTAAREIGDQQRIGTVLNALGNHALQQGDYVAARGYYQDSLHIKQEIGARLGIGIALGNLAIVAFEQGSLVEGEAYAAACLRERRAIGDARGIAHALGLLATVAGYRSQYAEAQRYFEEALEIQRSLNDRTNAATTIYNLAELARLRGQYSEALAYGEECLALCRALDEPWGIADALKSLGLVAYDQQEELKARQFYQEALKIDRKIYNQHGIGFCLIYLGSLDERIGALEEAERKLEEAITILRTVDDRILPLGIGMLAEVKRKIGHPQAIVYGLIHEALTIVRLKSNPEAQITGIIASLPICLAYEKYILLGEMIGLMHIKATSYADRALVDKILSELRPHLDMETLDAAIKRGHELQLDNAIERLLTELR